MDLGHRPSEVLGELPVAALADEITVDDPRRIRGLLSLAGNPAISTPDGPALERALARLDAFVCHDFYLNETTRHAHVILPATSPLQRPHYPLGIYPNALRSLANFSPAVLEPGLDEGALGKKLDAYDPRLYATYYAIDAVNFEPVKSEAVMDTVDGPYLPLVIQEAAGIPLDPSFAEQKEIMLRCKGIFYGCKDGAEARRLNRLLINAGIIRGL